MAVHPFRSPLWTLVLTSVAFFMVALHDDNVLPFFGPPRTRPI
jgi:hypothetical protein